ncbi:hypothetical protein AB0A98_06540 [Streptomyces chrestomyceticus]|uniref:helix-turn-helix domain-containing protein n=1 Tax=Streptomyces chrestomyceticus TaxID=68185 RepID=UPI0033E90635
MGEAPTSRGTIADRLTWLIKNRYPNGNGPSTYEEIAARSRQLPPLGKEEGEKGVSHQTVLNVASGKVKNPGVQTLKALARVFQVRVSYLLGETDEPTAEEGSPGDNVSLETLAKHLDYLFNVVIPNGRGPYTEAEVALAVSERGCTVEESGIRELRTGQGTADPSHELLACIADFFMVPVAYFKDPATRKKVSEDLELLNALKGVGARKVALRAMADLDEDDCQALVPVITHLREASRRQRM